MIKPGGFSDVGWMEDAACALPQYNDVRGNWFSKLPNEQYAAVHVCFSCPVRRRCLKWALENKQIHGVWGGKDEAELRRALSVSHTGQETRRKRFPNCPHCGARPSRLSVIVKDVPEGGRWATMKIVCCADCNFSWRSRTSANAVTAYHADKLVRDEKKLVVKAKAKAKAAKTKSAKP